jgi:two-component system CheB/CheR fusion protein
VNSNVFAMARDGLREDLHIALHWAATHKAPVTRNGIKVKTNGGYTTINLAVRLLSEPASVCGLLMVVFEEQPADTPAANEIASETHAAIPSSQLESELLRTRERLQITIEEMQATQEELRSTNEELQSNNEELQSTNEELNSSKEELQSLNEEMQTVNAELQSKMEELSQSNNDMMNLLNGIDIATLFLDNELCVKRFTPQIAQIVNLVASDVGRPLEHFATKLKHDGLVADAGAVLDRLTPKTMQVETDAGLWYNMRILPYRTTDNVIDGVVLTFADITPTKRLEESLRQQQTAAQTARDFAENIVATIREPLVVLDAEMRIISASRAFYLTFQTTPAKTERQSLYDIDRRQWDIPALRQLLGDILHKNTDLQDYRVELDFAHIGRRVFLLNAHRMVGDDRQSPSILLAMEDITARTPTETT